MQASTLVTMAGTQPDFQLTLRPSPGVAVHIRRMLSYEHILWTPYCVPSIEMVSTYIWRIFLCDHVLEKGGGMLGAFFVALQLAEA